MFGKMKHFRGIATRCNKSALSFMAFLHLAAILLWHECQQNLGSAKAHVSFFRFLTRQAKKPKRTKPAPASMAVL